MVPPERKAVSKFSQHGFVRSGIVNNDSTLNNPGREANYWSRSSTNSNNAFNLYFNNSNVNPSNNNYNRYNGMSLRCLYVFLVPDLHFKLPPPTPLFFVRSGVLPNSGTLYYPGRFALYWSHSSSSATQAFRFYFNELNIYSAYINDRYEGYSLRCLYAI